MTNPKNNILIAALDQPLETETNNSLSETLASSDHLIAVPVFLEKRGHPVLFFPVHYTMICSPSMKKQWVLGALFKNIKILLWKYL